jgi:hypothetical protein
LARHFDPGFDQLSKPGLMPAGGGWIHELHEATVPQRFNRGSAQGALLLGIRGLSQRYGFDRARHAQTFALDYRVHTELLIEQRVNNR